MREGWAVGGTLAALVSTQLELEPIIPLTGAIGWELATAVVRAAHHGRWWLYQKTPGVPVLAP